jgi:hypothetical protein
MERDPVFKNLPGLGLLACKIIDTTANIATIVVPAIDKPAQVDVPLRSIPRKIKPRNNS